MRQYNWQFHEISKYYKFRLVFFSFIFNELHDLDIFLSH